MFHGPFPGLNIASNSYYFNGDYQSDVIFEFDMPGIGGGL